MLQPSPRTKAFDEKARSPKLVLSLGYCILIGCSQVWSTIFCLPPSILDGETAQLEISDGSSGTVQNWNSVWPALDWNSTQFGRFPVASLGQEEKGSLLNGTHVGRASFSLQLGVPFTWSTLINARDQVETAIM